MFKNPREEEQYLKTFKQASCNDQLKFLRTLLHHSRPEVKYEIQTHIGDITKYDIILEVPLEIAEKIFFHLDLMSLLKCRQVSRGWSSRVNNFDQVWQPFLKRYCIDIQGFQANDEFYRKSRKEIPADEVLKDPLSNIGERLFKLSSISSELQSICSSHEDLEHNNIVGATSFILGRKLICNLEKQAGFNCVSDHDCRGSNVVMTMNSQIIAYAREDRHIVVKYTNFPHKKICVFEAHQCADIKIYEDRLITGGYDRSICIWEWDTGTLLKTLEGSIKPVYSLDVFNDILISSDGKSVITWSLRTFQMFYKTQCFEAGHVEELKIVDIKNCKRLNDHYTEDEFIVVVRSNKEIQVCSCKDSGIVTKLTNLEFHEEIMNFQPFIQIHEHLIACSSDRGIIAWDLVDFTVQNFIERDPCHACIFGARSTIFPRSNNCRVIMLYYSQTLLLQYFVHKNRFHLYGSQNGSKVELSWNFPSDEKWPWSHRKPGLASLVLNMENGFSMNTKLTLFVGTQGKKIYCMLFDASDLNYTTLVPAVENTELSDISDYDIFSSYLHTDDPS